MPDDLWRSRIVADAFAAPDPGVVPGGTPAFAGIVTSTGAALGVGKFCKVAPVQVTGTEADGSAGTFSSSTATVFAYPVGPGTPATGDYAMVRRVQHRWVFDKKMGGGCAQIVGTLDLCGSATMTVVGPNGATRTYTVSSGFFAIPGFDGDGTYTITFSGGNVYGRTITADLSCSTGVGLGTIYLRAKSVFVAVAADCGKFGISVGDYGINGAVVTISGDQTGTCTCPGGRALGCTVMLTDAPGTGPISGTITVAMDRYVSVSVAYSPSVPCAPSLFLDVTTDCYVCCGYPYPISRQFLLTTPFGSVVVDASLVYAASITASVLGHPSSGRPCCTGPGTPPGCCGGTFGLCLCGGAASTIDASFLVTTDCVPNTTIAMAHACGFYYPGASADPCNGVAGSGVVLWDFSTQSYCNGCYDILGTFDDEFPGPSSVANYFGGDYELRELPCDYMSGGGMAMMAAPSAPLPAGFPRAGESGKVKVGMLAPVLNQGGAEAVMLMQARTVDPSKVSWVGCAVTGDDRQIDPGMRDQLGEFMPVALGRPAAVALARECDLLIVWAIDGLTEILAESGTRARVISVVHAPPESPWGRTVYARPDGIDRWAAVSELARDVIPESSRTIPTATIGNAVDVARMDRARSREEMRAAWGIPADAKVAGFLGRTSAEKDPHAMARMVGHLPGDWHVVVVGSGAEAIAPHERLHLVGPDPRAGDVLGATDVLVVPSLYESFGLTIAEGLWAGVPVVSTPVGIAKLEPGLTRQVPLDADGPTLARAVLEAHASGPMPGSRDFARERFSPERFGREWTDLILATAPAPPKSPGLLAMAGNFVGSVVAHVADGRRKASPEVQAARMATCRACPFFEPTMPACNKCGCGSVVKGGLELKQSWASESCPEGKWPAT